MLSVLIGLSLVVNVGLSAGEENDLFNRTMDNGTLQFREPASTGSLGAIQVPTDFDTKTPTSLGDVEEQTNNLADIDRSSHHHYVEAAGLHYHQHHPAPAYHGFWKKKFVWRPRWVKTWQEKKVYVAVWKRMWAPASLKEWVPIPKPPPGWIRPSVNGLAVKTVPYYS